MLLWDSLRRIYVLPGFERPIYSRTLAKDSRTGLGRLGPKLDKPDSRGKAYELVNVIEAVLLHE